MSNLFSQRFLLLLQQREREETERKKLDEIQQQIEKKKQQFQINQQERYGASNWKRNILWQVWHIEFSIIRSALSADDITKQLLSALDVLINETYCSHELFVSELRNVITNFSFFRFLK